MEYKDYYKILGLSRNASDEEIKRQYRKLANKYHPDKNSGDGGAEAKFKEINEAYEVLKDKEKRQKYDNLGQSYQQYRQTGSNPSGFNWAQWYAQGNRSNASNFNGMFAQGSVSEFFEKIFGGFSSESIYDNTFSTPKQDVEAIINITLDDAFYGRTKTFVYGNEKISIRVKPGTKDNQKVKLTGKAGNQGSGDLILTFKIDEHSNMRRHSDDLETTLNVDLYSAILGNETFLNVFDETLKIKIPAGCDNNKILKIKNKGMPLYNKPSVRGDLYVKLNVILPKDLTQEEIDLFKKLKSISQSKK